MKKNFKAFFESTLINKDDLTIQQAAEIVYAQGKKWREIIGGFREDSLNWIFYRGELIRFNPKASVEFVRKDRRPMSTPLALHQVADSYFKETFGIKYRSQSVFATRSKDTASFYGSGKVRAIFPLGEVHYAWSKNVEDMTYALTFGECAKLVNKFGAESPEVLDFLKSLEYRSDDGSIADLIDHRDFKGHEIMIHCDSYVSVREDCLPKFLDTLLGLQANDK